MTLFIAELPAIYYLKALIGESYEMECFAIDKGMRLEEAMARANEEILKVIHRSETEENLLFEEMKLIEHAYRSVLSPAYFPIYEEIRSTIANERTSAQRIQEAIRALKRFCNEAGIRIVSLSVYDLIVAKE
jgi:hypothetical protein